MAIHCSVVSTSSGKNSFSFLRWFLMNKVRIYTHARYSVQFSLPLHVWLKSSNPSVFWAVDNSGVATPLVGARSNGTALQSLNHTSYCLTPEHTLDLLCSSAIEQGRDVNIKWINYKVIQWAKVSSLTYYLSAFVQQKPKCLFIIKQSSSLRASYLERSWT